MGYWRWLHAFALVAACGTAQGQPVPKTGSAGSAAQPPLAKSSAPDSGQPGPGLLAARGSAVESNDVPTWKQSPPRFAVTPFENYSNVRAFDWLVAGVPFEIAEKTEDVLGLEPVGGSLRVGPVKVAPEQEPVAAFGAQLDVPYVVTGWVDRANWNLRIALTLWKVTPGKPATAVVVAETQKTGDPKNYHAILGEALAVMWQKGAGIQIDIDRAARLQRSFATDVYAVNLMSRGLGHLIGVYPGGVNLKLAQADMEKAVFIDPKCPEAQRLLGELYLVLASADPKAGGDPRYANKALGKFAYANDLAPNNIGALRMAATGATRAGKHESARDILRRYVTRKPWELDARFEYGSALWQTGDIDAAQKQLAQVTARLPDHLPARRVLVLIHASRGDTSKLVDELEAIALRAPTDLEVKADLATAYGSVGKWDRATAQLEQIVAARPNDLALLVRIGDAKRRLADLDGALAWYARASRLAPDSGMPGFLAAQALFDAGKLPEAIRAYTNLQRFREDTWHAEHALGVLALIQNRATDAAWYLRRTVVMMPRLVTAWRSMIAAELMRKDHEMALKQLDRALVIWPRDAQLLYLAGVAHALANDVESARERLNEAVKVAPGFAPARSALGQLGLGASVSLQYTPELGRPWGDADAVLAALDRYNATERAMATSRAAYQTQFLKVLAALGKGPLAPQKTPQIRTCPIDRVASLWASAQTELRTFERLGVELEAAYKFIARHDDVGATAALLPNGRTRVAAAKKSFRVALADVGELRAEWTRGLVPELRFAGCYDKLLAAAVKDPERYRIVQQDKPDPIPEKQAPRPRPRATFYVDNTRCADPVDVWVDGSVIGQVAPGRRSALVSDGGERTLCLIVPGAAQCGDRGTVRQVYLHDGWAATMHCPK